MLLRYALVAPLAILSLGCYGSLPPDSTPPDPPGPIPVLPDPQVRLEPASPVLAVGDSVRMLPVTKNVNTGPGFIWRVLDTLVAQVDQTGLVRARRVGRTDVLAKPVSDTTATGHTPVIVE